MRGFLAIARHEVFVLLLALQHMWRASCIINDVACHWLISKTFLAKTALILLSAFWLPVLYGTTFNDAYSGGRTPDGHSRKYVNYPNHTSSYRCREVFWSLPCFLAFWVLALGYPILTALQVPEGSANFSFAGGSQLTGGLLLSL